MASSRAPDGRLILAAATGLIPLASPLIAGAQAAGGQGRGLPQALNGAVGQTLPGQGRAAAPKTSQAPGAQAAATATDDLAQAFRAEASAITGEADHMQVLLVQTYGWMRSSRTLSLGGEYRDGWILTALTSSVAVLSKTGSPAKRIDLTRWTGDTPAPASPPGRGAGGGQATLVVFGSLGMPTRAPGASELTGPLAAASDSAPTANPAPAGGAQNGAPAASDFTAADPSLQDLAIDAAAPGPATASIS